MVVKVRSPTVASKNSVTNSSRGGPNKTQRYRASKQKGRDTGGGGGGALQLSKRTIIAIAVSALFIGISTGGLAIYILNRNESTTRSAGSGSSNVRRNAKKIKSNNNNNNNNNNGKQEPVRDRDGDIVDDDVLIQDIKAGHIVDAKHVELEETDITPGENRWDKSKTIPPWLKDYFKWHSEIVPTLTADNWNEYSYIVMTCLGGQTCGNVAHRLRPIMGMLRVAADHQRIFMMHWDMPNRLDDFLKPPRAGGIDWNVPEFFMWKVRASTIVNVIPTVLLQAPNPENHRVVNVMYNDDTFAEFHYNDNRKEGEVEAKQAFKDVFNVLFKPSAMLAERTKETLELMGLLPGEYAAAHIDYENLPRDDSERQQLRLKVENAMNCMSHLRPGGPFLVAAQTYAVAREAIEYGQQHGVNIQAKQIAHDTSQVPKDLYQAFVEILLMAKARCVAYNRGGYGQLGFILGYDYDCKINYGEHKGECEWKDPPKPALVVDVVRPDGEGNDDDHHQKEDLASE